jgi:transposase
MKTTAYTIELRERAIAAYDQRNVSEAQIAALFGVGEASLRRWRRRKRETGSVAPTVHRKGPERCVDAEHEPIVRQLVLDHPDAFVEDLAIRFTEQTGRACSRSAMGRALDRLGLTRKKRR